MGARALKRQIERDLVRPAAEVLAGSSTDQAMLLRLYLDGEELRTRWQSVDFAERSFETRELTIDRWCELAEKYVDEVASQIDDGPLSFEISGGAMDPKLLEKMTLRDSLHECQSSLRALREAKDKPQLQRPQSTPIHVPSLGFPRGLSRFEPNPKAGLKDLQAIDDIQDFLRDSLVPLPPGQLDSQRDRLIDQIGRLHDQLDARGTAVRWLVRTQWYGEQFDWEAPEGSDLSTRGGNRAMLSSAIRTWASDVEALLLEDVDVKDTATCCFSGALAASTLREIAGSWMLVHRQGNLKLADVGIHPVDECQTLDVQNERWKHQQRRAPVAPVRRILQADGPQIDLVTGAVVHQPLAVDSIVKLLKMTRRHDGFLRRTSEVHQ
jgi:hypothetical protein